uniref:Putative secreted protein n=1 Tax=Anopheles darlingi TaxID=43151 RepID=A0A2M4D602_ANODA
MLLLLLLLVCAFGIPGLDPGLPPSHHSFLPSCAHFSGTRTQNLLRTTGTLDRSSAFPADEGHDGCFSLFPPALQHTSTIQTPP